VFQRPAPRSALLPLELPLLVPRARRRLRPAVGLLGPAFVTGIAYVDPGNFATNTTAGAQYGYRLLWVVLLAGLVAMPVQYLSAKLGIVTGQSLPEVCRAHLRPRVTVALWVQAELVAMATDVAEFVGAAIGLGLLFGVPLLASAGIVAVVAFGVLALQTRGQRRFEIAIIALLALVAAGFAYQTLVVAPSAGGALAGLIPRLSGPDSVFLAAGIVGATVMPHAIYVHSGLTAARTVGRAPVDRARLLRVQKVDVVTALGLAGLVNMSMLAVSAELFRADGGGAAPTLPQVHAALGTRIGGAAALAFAVALLAAGVSSSSVGTYAGQLIMSGFLRRSFPLVLRRLVTMLPAIVLLAVGVDPTRALVASQVLLCLGIPFALIPLLLLTSRQQVMGALANSRGVLAVMVPITAVIVALNVFLLYQQLLG